MKCPSFLVRSKRWLRGPVWVCLAFVGACATGPPSAHKGPASPPPETARRGEAQAGLRGPGPPVDPSLLQQEIQRRKRALELARAHLNRISPDSAKGPMVSWIQAMDEQVRRLESLYDAVSHWPASVEPRVEQGMDERVARLLFGCLTLDPLQPSLSAAKPASSVVEETRISWDPVRSAYKEADCPEANSQYEAITKAHPVALVPTDIQILHAVCLSRTDHRQEAIQTLEPLLLGQAQLLDTQYLQYQLANWLFEEGLLDRAEVTYRSLLEGVKERDRWAELARMRLVQIGLKRGEPTPTGPALAAAEPGAKPALTTGPSVESGVPSETPFRQGEGPAQGQSPSLASATPSIMEVRAARLKEAQRFLESEDYAQAIAVFQGLLGTEYERMAQEGIQEAQDRYAEKRRRQAAELVLRAHREPSAGKRKDLLIQALEILRETNARYPGNQYAAKIHRNIQDVVARIQGIDPGFEAEGPNKEDLSVHSRE